MNIYSLPAIISFTINFSIALIVLLDQPRSSINRWFAAFIFSFALWNIAEVLILNSRDIESAMLAAQILYRIIFLTPAIFLIIAYSFPKSFVSWSQRTVFRIFVFALPIILLSLSFPDFKIRLVSFAQVPGVYYYHFYFNNSPLFIALVILSLFYLMWGAVHLTHKIKKLLTIRQKNQTRFLLFGILSIAFLFLAINAVHNILAPQISFYFLSTILTFIISLFFLAAIWQVKIIKLSHVVKSGIVYSILSSTVLIVYFVIVSSLSDTLIRYFHINSFLINATIIAMLIILIRPFESRLQRLINRFINRDINKYRHNFYKLSRELLTYMEPRHFFKRIESFLMSNFQAKNVFILLQNRAADYCIDIETRRGVPSLETGSTFVQEIFKKKKAVEYYALQKKAAEKKALDFFEKQQIQLVLPLIFEERLLAIILMSCKKTGRDYTEDEIEILSIFSNEIAIAYQRNTMIDNVREQDQRQFRLQRLASLGQLTAGIAHEIRNPLNTISSAAETMLRKKLPPEDETDMKHYIIDEVNRLNRILTDFLKLSKMRPPTIEYFQPQAVLNPVMLAMQTAEESSIQIETDIKIKQAAIKSDSDLLKQILLNLGLNALEAVKERCRIEEGFDCADGTIVFSVAANNNDLILTARDNGVGILQQDMDSLYDPFFTTKEHGTGLGLAIVHNIVESLAGEVKVESHQGRTAFTIVVPGAIEPNEEARL